MLEFGTTRASATSRRSFLRVGALGFAGLTLADVLKSRAVATAPRTNKAVILLWMAGGPSHIDTFDMKPQAPAEIRGPFQAVPTTLRGLDICELLPRHAQLGKHLAIVRSLHHKHNVHDDASHWVQTGYPLLNARERGQQNPAQGAVVAYLRRNQPQDIPAYACIPESYSTRQGFYQSAAFLGSRFNPLDTGGDPSLGNYRPPQFNLPADLSLARLEQRQHLLSQVNSLVQRMETTGAIEDLDQVQRQAFELVTGSRACAAFDMSREPDRLRDKYGRHAWGQSALMARRLVEAGVSFVTINLYERDVDWWDDHFTIEKNLRKRLPLFDQACATLIEDLRERGMSDDVLVVACGEFGRSPRIDSKNAGRGHWPGAMSALLSGGGIRGGQVIGSTVSDGSQPNQRPLVPGDLLATIYTLIGIDPAITFRDRTGRPIRAIDEGEPIRELL